LTAEIALAADSVEKAIAYFKNLRIPTNFRDTQRYELVLPNNIFYNIPLDKDIVARALIKKGDIDGAIEAYEQITEFHPDQKGRFFINPKYHYRLARLYQQTGQRQKAIERYKRFLDIWKYADAGLPEKVDAEKQLAVLESE
jgi:tetratricopeptide (TPR) repeat protein